MIKEFKEFIAKGSLVDLAVAFVMGLAFAGLVTTFISRIVNPLLGMIFNVSSLENTWTFGRVDEATGLPAGSVGAFVGAIINFLVVAFVMYLVVKAYNRMRRPAEAAAPSEDTVLLREIRDSLRRP
ncbi:MAG TPA: large conductance mechanosensitive channel protein MscL [Acidimicrobiia bacterium]|nr:large conductance mechanosensitive channel protein MscL [Acidimicrobiia bacterium]